MGLIVPHSDNPYPLGRHLHHDERNKQHRAFALVPDRPDIRSLWYTGDVYKQLSENCTTEAAIGTCRTSPLKPFPHWGSYTEEAQRVAFYLWCQKFDPPEWGMPHGGSASDSPYKGLRELGHIIGWKWLFGIQEVKQWVMYNGPCSAGTIWLKSMFTADIRGYIVVDRLSAICGGHEWRIVGYSPKRRAFKMVNSWGRDWGMYGRAWIREDDLDWLLQQNGDAVAVVPK